MSRSKQEVDSKVDCKPDSKSPAPSKTKFPPALNAYFPLDNFLAEFYIGPNIEEKPSVDERAYLVRTFNSPVIAITDGPSKGNPVLANISVDKWLKLKPVTVTLPPRPNSHHEEPITMEMSAVNVFQIVVSGTNETFEWRSIDKKDKEFKVMGGLATGWKLVRLSSSSSKGLDKPKKRLSFGFGLGFSRKGPEVVAVLAYNESATMKKALRFTFMGSGSAGVLGEEWEIMAVATALHLWWFDIRKAVA